MQMLMAESTRELKLLRWNKCMETKGLKKNISKTKVIVSGDIESTRKWMYVCCLWEGY